MKLFLAFALIALAASAGIITKQGCTTATTCGSYSGCKLEKTVPFATASLFNSVTVGGITLTATGNCENATLISSSTPGVNILDLSGNAGSSTAGANFTAQPNGAICVNDQGGVGNEFACSPASALQPVAWLAALCALLATHM